MDMAKSVLKQDVNGSPKGCHINHVTQKSLMSLPIQKPTLKVDMKDKYKTPINVQYSAVTP